MSHRCPAHDKGPRTSVTFSSFVADFIAAASSGTVIVSPFGASAAPGAGSSLKEPLFAHEELAALRPASFSIARSRSAVAGSGSLSM